MQKRFFMYVISIFILACFNSSVNAATDAAHSNKFMTFSDIHFDPFSGCHSKPHQPCELLQQLRNNDYHKWDDIFTQYGPPKLSSVLHDTNYPLLQSTLNQLKEINGREHPYFGLILGDFLAHDFRRKYTANSKDTSFASYQAFVKKTMQYLTYKIHQTLPELELYPAIGNDDSYTGDYRVTPGGDFLRDTAHTWSQLIHNKTNQQRFSEHFPRGGYYSVIMPNNPRQRIIVLNTVLFSQHIRGKNIAAAAERELTWLHQQLELSKQFKQQVLLAFHIPVGTDVYATVHNHFGQVVQFWQSQYSDAFQKEVTQFSSEIVAILPAHIHIISLRFISLKSIAGVPVIFTPAISPIYGNKPSFRLFSYNAETFKPKSFAMFSLNSSGRWWKE